MQDQHDREDIPREADPESELRALSEVVGSLQRLPNNDLRERVLQAVAAFFGISGSTGAHSQYSGRSVPRSVNPDFPAPGSFSEDRTILAKDFLLQKQPHTEVERVACLAYYLRHYQDIPYFKTIDISKLNTEAAQPKFVNASQAVENATKTHYLVPATKGNKQLSAAGELFVQALPDRDAARAAMVGARPRRRRKATQQTSNSEEDRADE